MFAYRENGTRFEENHVQIKDRSGRKTVAVWAWMTASGAGDFVRINGKLDSEKYLAILGDVLLPSIHQRFGRKMKFIQDKSPIHESTKIKDWLADHAGEIELLPWPPKGADLNPIENVWGDMVKESEFFRLRSPDEVFDRANDTWNGYSRNRNYWQKLALSMPRRLRSVIDNNGLWTKY